jgi:hypothetical protein
MIVLKTIAMSKALKLKLFKYAMIEDLQAKGADEIFIFILEYRNVVLSREMQH